MPGKPTGRDDIFAAPVPATDFVFDETVAAVFDDMVNRSIPGYAGILSMIAVLAERYFQPATRIYDLGCSLGGASYAIAERLRGCNYSIQAIDNSAAMIKRLQRRLDQQQDNSLQIHCRCADILQTEIVGASIVVLNFTLQFIRPERRQYLMDRIYQGLNSGGILILSEKMVMPDAGVNAQLTELHHTFKQAMGYSQLEISQKRSALENVLIPETMDTHRQRLTNSGFRSTTLWFQCFNFASMIAVK